jgi:hypothetical protein
MKIKTLVAASALAAAGFVGATTHSASAACGVTAAAHNRDGTDSATVNYADSDVRIRTWIGWPFNYWQEGPWGQFGTGSSTVPAGDTRNHNETLTFNCGAQRQYRFEVTDTSGTRWVYFPSVDSGGSSPTGWTTNIAPHFHI